MPRGPRSAETISKLEGVRRALATLGGDAKPLAIQAHLRKEFGIRMEPAMMSSYKTLIRSQGNRSGLIRKPEATGQDGAFSPADIQAVQEVAGRIGADKVRRLSEVLARHPRA